MGRGKARTAEQNQSDLDKWAASGLSQKDFAQQEGISFNTLATLARPHGGIKSYRVSKGINEMILDQLVSSKIQDIVLSSKTILWNGPLGVFENDYFSKGTKELSKEIAKSDGFSIAGGGETLSAINKFINKDDVSYCSTGGGAFLEFMEGKDLPSIQALKAKI